MNSLSRFTLGTLTSVFLSIGMVRFASQLDPVTKLIGQQKFDGGEAAALGCEPCDLVW